MSTATVNQSGWSASALWSLAERMEGKMRKGGEWGEGVGLGRWEKNVRAASLADQRK